MWRGSLGAQLPGQVTDGDLQWETQCKLSALLKRQLDHCDPWTVAGWLTMLLGLVRGLSLLMDGKD